MSGGFPTPTCIDDTYLLDQFDTAEAANLKFRRQRGRRKRWFRWSLLALFTVFALGFFAITTNELRKPKILSILYVPSMAATGEFPAKASGALEYFGVTHTQLNFKQSDEFNPWNSAEIVEKDEHLEEVSIPEDIDLSRSSRSTRSRPADIAAHVALWLVPWLFLTSQIPFQVRDIRTHFQFLLLCLGSPFLALFSMFLCLMPSKRKEEYPGSRPIVEGIDGTWKVDAHSTNRLLEDGANEKWLTDTTIMLHQTGKRLDTSFWGQIFFAIISVCLSVEEGFKYFGGITHA